MNHSRFQASVTVSSRPRRPAAAVVLAFGVMLLCGCDKPVASGPGVATQQAAVPQQEGDARLAAGGSEPTADPQVGALTLAAGYRSCEVDADCVVAPSLAGLDHVPGPGESCEGTCYVGIHADHLDAWLRAREQHLYDVPCDKEFEECPPADAFVASCAFGTCRVSSRR